MAVFSYIKYLEKKEKRFEVISLTLLVILLVLTPTAYLIMPDVLIELTGANGKVERLNSKETLFIYPVVGTIIYIALSIIKYYLIKYRETSTGPELEHATTVWILRLAKVVVLTGLVISVLEAMSAAYKGNSSAVAVIFAAELVVVAAVFTVVFKEILDKLHY
jgi:O-antigen/teichoic acid export membrane protein